MQALTALLGSHQGNQLHADNFSKGCCDVTNGVRDEAPASVPAFRDPFLLALCLRPDAPLAALLQIEGELLA